MRMNNHPEALVLSTSKSLSYRILLQNDQTALGQRDVYIRSLRSPKGSTLDN
jgi:hypothetical protein